MYNVNDIGSFAFYVDLFFPLSPPRDLLVLTMNNTMGVLPETGTAWPSLSSEFTPCLFVGSVLVIFLIFRVVCFALFVLILFRAQCCLCLMPSVVCVVCPALSVSYAQCCLCHMPSVVCVVCPVLSVSHAQCCLCRMSSVVCVVCPVLSVSLACPFLIALLDFCNVYMSTNKKDGKQHHVLHMKWWEFLLIHRKHNGLGE